MVSRYKYFGRVGLALLLALTLAACGQNPSVSNNPPTTLPPTTTLPQSSATPMPPTVLPTSVPPTPVVPPVTPHSSGLLGPEWTVAARGDFSGDGMEELIAYRPTDVVPQLTGPAYAGYNYVTSEVVVVQAAADGSSQMLLTISPTAVTAAGQELLSWGGNPAGGRSVAAFLLAVHDPRGIVVGVIPLEASGDAYGQGAGFYWNWAEGGYRLAMPGAAGPPADERLENLFDWTWLFLASDEPLGEGNAAISAYRPAFVTPAEAALSPFEGRPVVVAEQVAVRQPRAEGQPVTTLNAGLLEIVAEQPGQGLTMLYRFSNGGPPAALAVAVDSETPLCLSLLPLSADGSSYGPLVHVCRDEAQGGYRVE
ncbi:MAG: hypothetical protein MUD01_13810 [Chloroflexaceae bacterium]|jgi:hypothetical protein|nr:hypothetical protein [Chloroflexaceae bacterium]